MLRAARTADMAHDQDDADVPLELEDAPNLPVADVPADTLAQIIIRTAHNIVNMCKTRTSPSLEPSGTASSRPASPSSPPSAETGSPSNATPKTGRNKRTTNRRRRRRENVSAEHEDRQLDPDTREPLSFPARLVEKYGTVDVKDTVKMNWFSVPDLAHAVGAFIGTRVLKIVKRAGWSVDSLLGTRGFTLVEWDGRYVP